MVRFKLKPISLCISDVKHVKLSTYGIASMYFRASLPLALAISLYLSKHGNEELRQTLESILGTRVLSIIERSLEASDLSMRCRDLIVKLCRDENKKAIEKVLEVAKDNLVRELRWEDLLDSLVATSSTGAKPLMSDKLKELKNVLERKIGDGIRNLLEIADFPELLYPQHAEDLLRCVGLNDEYVSGYVKLLESLYNCLMGLYNEGLKRSGREGPWLLELVNSLGIPITFRPSSYYLLVYFDADDASQVFSGSQGRYAGLLGANLYPFLAIEAISKVIMLSRDELDIPVPIQPFYMAGDDYLLMSPAEVFVPIMTTLSHIAEELGLAYSVVALVTHIHTPLREAVALAHRLMSGTAKEARVLSIGAEKSLFVFARVTSGGQIDLNVVPLKLLNTRRLLSLVHNLLNLLATRTRIRKRSLYARPDEREARGGRAEESLYALAREVVDAYRMRRREDYEVARFKLLRGLATLGLELDASTLENLLHEELVEIPRSPAGSITRVNLGVEVLSIAIQLRTILPYTLWPRWLRHG